MAESAPLNDERREELVAYLDGELEPQAAEQFEERLQQDAALRQEAEALKRTWELLDFLPQQEPSDTFTSKTLDKITVLRPAVSGAVTLPAEAVTVPPRRSKWPIYLGWTAAALVLFVAGFVVSGPAFRKAGSRPETRDPSVIEDEMARDLRLLHQLPQLEVGEDIAFLQALDHPELFGEQRSGR